MHYGNIKQYDIADGEGCRTTLFVSGCTNHCKNCFQPETWDFDYGEPFTRETLTRLDKELEREEIEGLTILGGEPLHPKNVGAVADIVSYLKIWKSEKSIWIYTGYTFEELICGRDMINILQFIDVLVDGAFEEQKKNLLLEFRGSENQRIIDVKKTIINDEVTLWENPQKGRP